MMRKIDIGLLLAALLLAGFSCVPRPHNGPGAQGVPDGRKAEIAGVLAKADELVAAGDFKGALDSQRDAADKFPGDEDLRKGYIATIEAIKREADKAFENHDAALSGKTYYLLLKSSALSNGFSDELSFSKRTLTERLRECRSALSQEALAEYRSGNIENAISLWKSILTFDPGNESVKKSIETATTQLKNLKRQD